MVDAKLEERAYERQVLAAHAAASIRGWREKHVNLRNILRPLLGRHKVTLDDETTRKIYRQSTKRAMTSHADA